MCLLQLLVLQLSNKRRCGAEEVGPRIQIIYVVIRVRYLQQHINYLMTSGVNCGTVNFDQYLSFLTNEEVRLRRWGPNADH